MREIQGKPLPLGVTITNDRMNFALAVPQDSECELLLYRRGEKEPLQVYELAAEYAAGEVRCLAVEDADGQCAEYLYRVDGEYYPDPYAKAYTGRAIWGEPEDASEGMVRGMICREAYDWEEDRPLKLPVHQVVSYSLHVRGFTRHSSSKVKHKGTFRGVIEKLPYLTELGINQIHCMPIYEFQEKTKTGINYWGYGPGYFFAPKSAYAASKDGVRECKDMVKACHRAGVEVVLEMPFDSDTPKQMMIECLRFWRLDYHVDGFILNPVIAPMEMISADPLLKNTKILTHRNDFQNVMRRFLKGDEGMVGDVIYWLKHRSDQDYNYITNQNGFTLNDLVSYDSKHNEANGENNQDGPDYNYSWNCGVEGPSRKKAVTELRKNQIRNAFLLLLFAQGAPCLLAGDEFGNTQKGNNNVYCQDNPVGWLDWSRLKKQEETYRFVKELIALRKAHPVFRQAQPLRGMDVMKCGVPDVSYHGEYAWRVQTEVSSRQLGVYYCGAAADDEDCFVIYNMHWLEHSFALPALPKKKKWHVIASTKDGVIESPVPLEDQHDLMVDERTIMILAGR